MAQPTGTFTYVFDPDGRISNLTNPEGQVTSWSYDANSRVTQQVLGNGVVVSNTYDNADRLLVLANIGSGGITLSSFAYTFNRVGNRTQVIEVDGSVVTWSYDPTYQLTNEQRSGSNSYNITYSYDGVGNRTLMVDNGIPSTYAYNAANEIATSQNSAGLTTYTFDGDGNLLSSLAPGNQVTTNIWDGESRLTQVVLPSAISTFAYNGDGQRVQQQDSAGTTNHLWDKQNILLETNAANSVQAVYTLEPLIHGNLISQIRGAVSSYYLFDVLGSTRQIATPAGGISDSYLFDSWGNTLSASGATVIPFRYIGRLLYYYDPNIGFSLRAREYDPVSARFLSRDPIGPPTFETNLYRYANGNPVSYQDPSGFGVVIPIAVGVGVVVFGIACVCKRQAAYDKFGGTPCTATQENCLKQVRDTLNGLKLQSSLAGWNGCYRHTYCGKGAGGDTEVFNGCFNLTVIGGADISCSSCAAFVSLLATFVHECYHQSQSAGIGTTGQQLEAEAYAWTIKFLKAYKKSLCIDLARNGVCNSVMACRAEVAKQIGVEEGGWRIEGGGLPVTVPPVF